MGQGIIRSPSVSEREILSDNSATMIVDAHAVSCPTYMAKSATTTFPPPTSLLQPDAPTAHSTVRPLMTASSSVPDIYSVRKGHPFKLPHLPPIVAQHKDGRGNHGKPQEGTDGNQSDLATAMARTTHMHAAAGYTSAAVSASEAMQRRDNQYLDKIMVRAAEDVVAVPAGELECLASGFLSIADYVYVAETLKGLSSLLLSENERAVQFIQTARRRNDSGSFNNSATTPGQSPFDDNEVRDEGVNTVGALINNTAAVKVALLPWTMMRDALIAQRVARSTSVSDFSHATMSMQHSTTMDASRAAGIQHTAVFKSSSRPEGSLNERHSKSPRKGTSTQRASALETGLTGRSSLNGVRSQAGIGAIGGVSGFTVPPRLPPSVPTSHMALTPSLPSMVLATAETVRPLSLEDLIDVTTQDEVLDVFLQSMSKKMRGLSKKLRVLTPFAAFRYCIATLFHKLAAAYKVGTAAPAQASSRTRGMFGSEDSLQPYDAAAPAAAEAEEKAKSDDAGWVFAETVVLQPQDSAEIRAKAERDSALNAVGDDVRRLFNDTKGLLLKALTCFADAMPLGINSRFNNNYLLPTEPIPASFIACGVHTSRRKEFFVSMAERTKLLEGHHAFHSPEEILLGISQLSNLASQMISVFAVGAVLACTQQWRELHEACTTNTDDVGNALEDFAVRFCAGFDVMCNEAFPTLRKQYPNVFVVSSFVVKEEEGGRPPMVTVAMSCILKLLFLFAGGLGSIRADDRRLMAAALKDELKRRDADRHTSTGTSGVSSSSSALQPSSDTSKEAAGSNSSRRELSSFVSGVARNSHTASLSTDRRRGPLGGGGEYMSISHRSQISGSTRPVSPATDDEGGMADDVALATALHVRSASVLVLLGSMLLSDPLATQVTNTHESVRLAHAVSRLWRVLFQFAGLLPHGTACPTEMAKWLPLFPLYLVNSEAKRTLLQVYAKLSDMSPLCMGPIRREEVLQSTANIVTGIVKASSEVRAGATRPPSSSAKANPSPLATRAHTPRGAASTVAMMATTDLSTTADTAISYGTDDGTSSGASTEAAVKDRASVLRLTTHVAATLSHCVIPIFVTGAKKNLAMAVQTFMTLRSGSKMEQSNLNLALAKELRQDLFDLAARQVADPFLPAVNLGKETRAVPLPGGLATFQTDLLEENTAATLRRLSAYKDRLAVVVSWEKSAAAAQRGSRSESARMSPAPGMVAANAPFTCPIRAGDEITIRWGKPLTPAPQRHPVLAVLRTTSSFQFLVVLDSPNYLSTYPVATAGAMTTTAAAPLTTAIGPPTPSATGQCRGSSLVASTGKGLVNRRQSTISLKSTGLVFLEDAASHAPCVADILLYRRQVPPLSRDGGRGWCAWTNPQLAANAPTAPTLPTPPLLLPMASSHQQQQRLSAAVTADAAHPEEAVAVLLGWLLGQAPGNEVTFALPLPPLAFRILGHAVHFDETVEEVQLDAADVSLQRPGVTKTELCQRTLDEMRRYLQSYLATHPSAADDTFFSGTPAVAHRQYQHLKTHLKEILVSMSWSGQPTEMVVRSFWSAMLQGMRQTPLVDTPIFAQCCARTLRDVLCGPHDLPDLDFSFRESFLLMTNLNAPLNAYRNYVRKCVKGVLDEEFSIAEKRLLMRFITGHTLRTQPAHMEMICIDVQHTFATVSDGYSNCNTVQLNKPRKAGKDMAEEGNEKEKAAGEPVTRATIDTTLQLLPVGRSSYNTLLIPNYFEALLMGSYRERVLGADYPWMEHRSHGDGTEVATDAISGDTCRPGTAAAAAKEAMVLQEDDFQFAWASLSLGQQETLKRRFREMLVQRLRAALYAFLVSRDDGIEASWELAEKLKLAVSPSTLLVDATMRDCAAARGNKSGGGGTFMRRHDGTLVFIDDSNVDTDDMEEFGELPFDDDDDFSDDTYSESMEGRLGEMEGLLGNSDFCLFGEAGSVDGQAPLKAGGAGGHDTSVSGSLNSEQLEMDAAAAQQQQQCDDSAARIMGQNGYHSAASFCFDCEVAVPPVAKADVVAEEHDVDGEKKADNATAHVERYPVFFVEEAGVTTTSDTDSPASARAGGERRSSSHSEVRTLAAATPPRNESIVTPRMSTLLQQVRAAHPGSPMSSATAPPPLNMTASSCTSPSSQRPSMPKTSNSAASATRRPSYALGTFAATAAAVRVAPQAKKSGSRATSEKANDLLMAEVDSGIRELFPDKNFLSV